VPCRHRLGPGEHGAGQAGGLHPPDPCISRPAAPADDARRLPSPGRLREPIVRDGDFIAYHAGSAAHAHPYLDMVAARLFIVLVPWLALLAWGATWRTGSNRMLAYFASAVVLILWCSAIAQPTSTPTASTGQASSADAWSEPLLPTVTTTALPTTTSTTRPTTTSERPATTLRAADTGLTPGDGVTASTRPRATRRTVAHPPRGTGRRRRRLVVGRPQPRHRANATPTIRPCAFRPTRLISIAARSRTGTSGCVPPTLTGLTATATASAARPSDPDD
jgi:hypothetical protein